MQKSKYFLEIDNTKGFSIILAVFGHAAPDAVKGFWIVGQDSLSASLHSLVYSFHMALFFVCSGFLLYPKLEAMGGVGIRFKRLMIPYLFLSIVYLGAKMFGGGLADNPLTDNPLIGIIFGKSPCYGAWFLWVLFVMNFLVILLYRTISLTNLLIIFCVVSFLPIKYNENFFGIEKVQHEMMWLVLGCLVRKYYMYVERFIALWVVLIFASILVSLHLLEPIYQKSAWLIVHFLTMVKTFSGVTASFVMCYFIAKKMSQSNIVNKTLKICSDYCMDIYILSMFVLVPLRILYVNYGGMNIIPYYIWLIIATLLGVIVPIVMSKYIVRKSRILKVLLLGS